MKYSYEEPPENANSGWMGHRLELFVPEKRRQEFQDYLGQYCGLKDQDWRIKSQKKGEIQIFGGEPTRVRFRVKRHAALVKLQWVEDENPRDKWMEKWSATMKSISQIGGIGGYYGRGQVACIKPVTNPLPWLVDYDSYLPISRKTQRSLLGLDEAEHVWATNELMKIARGEAEVTRTRWDINVLKSRGDTVMTTRDLEERLATSPSSSLNFKDIRSGEPSEPAADRTSE